MTENYRNDNAQEIQSIEEQIVKGDAQRSKEAHDESQLQNELPQNEGYKSICRE